VGDVLKQGRYEPSRSYHFPSLERRRNAKIDIYRHVGSCIIGVDPDAKSLHEVSVSNNDPSAPAMKLKVNVQSSVVDVAKQRETRTKAVKSQAKDYLTKYNIEEKLSEAVKALLKDQPADPMDFLCRHLMASPLGGASQVSSPQAAARNEKPAMRNVQIGAPVGKPNGQLAMKPFDGYYKSNILPNISGTCLNSIYSLFPGAAKRLKPGVSAPAAPDKGALDGLRNQAREVLVKASANGGLAAALKDVRREEPAKESFTYKPSVGTWLAKPTRPKKVQVFSKMPSVGTWLMLPSKMEPEPNRQGHLMPNNLLMGPEAYSLGMPFNTMRVI